MAPDRFQITAVIDRLIYESEETFARGDAISLRALLPKLPAKRSFSDWLQIGVKGSTTSGSMSGEAAGFGHVQLDGEKKSFEFESASGRTVRAGQWKIRRDRESIEIEQVMANEIDEGRSVLIHFEGEEPIRMDLLVARQISLWRVSLRFFKYQPWKTPV